jgi:hypothetical protein
MKDTDKFTVNEISSIINVCKDSKVSYFNYLGLEMILETDAKLPNQQLPKPVELSFQGNASFSESENSKLEDVKELEMQNLMLDDPLEYEKRMVDDQNSLRVNREFKVSR